MLYSLNDKCNLCGKSQGQSSLYSITRFSEPFNIIRCDECGLISQYPIPKEDFYNEGYYEGSSDYCYVNDKDDLVIRKLENTRRISNITDFLPLIGSEEPRLLDIGCSFGSLVRSAIDYGWIADGLETSKYVQDNVKDINIIDEDICNKDFELVDKYDAITMIEVFEHLKDPSQAVKNCHKVLGQNGLLVIQTTNMDSIVRTMEKEKSRYFLPGHLYYFSVKTLRRILEDNGFEVEKIYYGHETGFVPAMIRKMLTNINRLKMSDAYVFIYTLVCHLLSKIHIGDFAVHNGVVIYARKKHV